MSSWRCPCGVFSSARGFSVLLRFSPGVKDALLSRNAAMPLTPCWSCCGRARVTGLVLRLVTRGISTEAVEPSLGPPLDVGPSRLAETCPFGQQDQALASVLLGVPHGASRPLTV